MSFRRAKLFFSREHAVVSQPFNLLVVSIVAGVILTLLCLSIPNLVKDSQIHQVECEIDRILIEVTNMYEYANNGSIASVHVDFPSSLRFIVFGNLPRSGTAEPINLSLNEATSNNYYYVMNDGTVRIFHSNARFSNHNMTQIALFCSGAYTITIKLCHKEENTYVTMYERYK